MAEASRRKDAAFFVVRGREEAKAAARGGKRDAGLKKVEKKAGKQQREEKREKGSPADKADDEKEGKRAAGGGGAAKKDIRKHPVQRILEHDRKNDTFLVKRKDVSYRRLDSVSRYYLESKNPQLLRNFGGGKADIDPDWVKVERVIAKRTTSGGRQYLVKWRGLEYAESTWEWEEDLQEPEDKAAVERFKRVSAPKTVPEGASERALRDPEFPLPQFCSGRSLRDYQQVSVRWMVNNYCQRRNCILGDEMGLGKTAQSISVLETLRVVGGVGGPFLIVAPLTTLGHWQREIQTWTDMNAVLYAGSAADRAVIQEHEFFRSPGSTSKGVKASNVKFDVLLVSYEVVLKERGLLGRIPFAAGVFDEAHRLKGINSSTRAAVTSLDIEWMLLLTGTPIQNNMMELYAILNLLDPEEYPSPEDFNRRFGGGPGQAPSVDQIKALQAALAPVLLRRMKEDVEQLPEKEEVVIWVELTALQRVYYRSMYEGQIGALLAGGRSLPAMRNLAMQLRKLCCHPALCDGLEEDMQVKMAAQRAALPPDAAPEPEFSSAELELLVRGSGKMVLLHKLLPKLRAEGRKVLIFSQFVIMLNVLEDYCQLMGYPVERIDGSVRGRERQQAIDRFTKEDGGDDQSFVFLLSTRAGGQGITLTSADTCIIYDSDWNPQNDLQAMARCHRIGQKKEVTVYRLISRDTYEMALFSTASRKYGLDEAILGFSAGTDPEADAARISELLRHGAHGMLTDMEAAAKQGEAFAGEDISQILTGRTEKRQIGSRAGNTFSVATFAVEDEAAVARRQGGRKTKHDEEYWRSLLPEAVAAYEEREKAGPIVLGPRKRNKVNYNVDSKKRKDASDSDKDSDYTTGEDDSRSGAGGGAAGAGAAAGDDGAESQGTDGGKKRGRGKGRKSAADGEAADELSGRYRKGRWGKTEVKALETLLAALGPGRWADMFALMQPTKRTAAEVEEVGKVVWELYQQAKLLVEERDKAMWASVRTQGGNVLDELLGEDAAAGAGGGGGGAEPQAGSGSSYSDEPYNARMLDLLGKLPETVKGVLHNPETVKRFFKDVQELVRHANLMRELHDIMRPQAPQQQQHGGEGGSGGQVLKVPYLSGAGVGSLPRWWAREDDEALAMAAVQVGYPPSQMRRVVDHALLNPPLSRKLVLVDEPPAAAPEAAEGNEGAGAVKKDAAASDGGDTGDDTAMVGEAAAPAATTAAVKVLGTPTFPVRMTGDEWRALQRALTRRLVKVVTQTIEHHRRLASRASALPSAKPPAAPAAAPIGGSALAGAGAAKPHSHHASTSQPASGSVPGTGAGSLATAKPVAAAPVPAAAKAPPSQPQQRQPLQHPSGNPMVLAAAAILNAAAAARASPTKAQAQQAADPKLPKSPVQAAVAAVLAAAARHQAVLPNPLAAKSGSGNGAAAAGAEAAKAPAAAPAAAGAQAAHAGAQQHAHQGPAAPGGGGGGVAGGGGTSGKKSSGKRQSMLPFAKLAVSKTPAAVAAEAADRKVVAVRPSPAGAVEKSCQGGASAGRQDDVIEISE